MGKLFAAGVIRQTNYATDGKCHNAQYGTFGQECGRPAVWIGTNPETGFRSGFCDKCKRTGDERHGKTFQPFGGN